MTDMTLIAGRGTGDRLATGDASDPNVDWSATIRLGVTMSATAAAAAMVTHGSLGPIGQGALVLTVIVVGFTGSLLRTLRD
ncbi:MAG: hypothetical protein O2886_01190 [Actinomycetota bacterium]|nr:hypothetical protein [Actinomycetota bacterium]